MRQGDYIPSLVFHSVLFHLLRQSHTILAQDVLKLKTFLSQTPELPICATTFKSWHELLLIQTSVYLEHLLVFDKENKEHS